MSDVDILLLAGGKSSRMRGRDKLLETVRDVPLIYDRAQMCLATSAQRVILVTAPEHHQRRKAVENLDVTHVLNQGSEHGMSDSLKAGIKASTAKAVLIMLGDLPDLTTDDLDLVIQQSASSEAVVIRGAADTGTPGHPVLIKRPLFDSISQLEGDQGAAPVLKAHKSQTLLVPLPGRNALNDLDTPEAWNAWRERQEKPL